MIPNAEITSAVKDRYAKIATGELSSCCDDGCCSSDAAAITPDYETDLSSLPLEVTGVSLGCGDPIALARLEAGQTVLDLGSGGGIDCFLAAERVGATGHVIGVDMTDEMIALARRNKQKMGVDNVEFRLGQIEQLPVADSSVDVIISNCVINLSSDKAATINEAYRVLRPGGKLAISDMVTLGRFEEQQWIDLAAWSGCIAGAAEVQTMAGYLQAAGFSQIEVRDKEQSDVELSAIDYDGKPRLLSARITATKPE